MIVECIDDQFYVGVRRRVKARGRTPIKGQLYEVVDVVKQFVEGEMRTFYILHEFRPTQFWQESFFREVDVNIEEIKEVLELEAV